MNERRKYKSHFTAFVYPHTRLSVVATAASLEFIEKEDGSLEILIYQSDLDKIKIIKV